MIFNTLITLLFTVVLFTSTQAQTIISSDEVSGIWSKTKSPYIVQGRPRIEANKSLIIQAGVEVRFEADAQLRAYGSSTIIADGTAEAPIIFTSASNNPQPGDWESVLVSDTETRCSFSFCEIEFSTVGLVVQAFGSGCNNGYNATTVENCTFRYNEKSGLQIAAYGSSTSGCIPFGSLGTSSPEVHHNFFYENTGTAVWIISSDGYYSSGSAKPVLSHNVLYDNGDAIRVQGDDWASPKILHNTIVSNEGSGITYENPLNKEFKIVNNIIAQNTLGIFSLSDSLPAIGYNNIWSNEIDYQGLEAAASNISKAPLFRDQPNYDFRLICTSPCIDAGDPVQAGDPDGSIPDIGAFSFDQTISVNFSSDKQEGYAGDKFKFTSSVTTTEYNITKWLWDFGDGKTGSTKNPSHTYAKKGTYPVSLTVKDTECGSSKTRTKSTWIKILNSPPVLTNPPGEITINEDQMDSSIIVSSIFSDLDEDILSYTFIAPEHIEVFLINNKMQVVPMENWSGTEPIKIIATDNEQASAEVDVLVTVLPINDAPQLKNNIPDLTIDEDIMDSSLNVTNLFYDPDGDLLEYSYYELDHISISLNNDFIRIVPDANWYGTDTLKIVATDPSLESVIAVIYLTVKPINDSPELITHFPETLELEIPVDTSITFILNADDIDSELDYTWSVNGVLGSSQIDTFTYTFPEVGEFQIDGIVKDEEFEVLTSWIVTVTNPTSVNKDLSDRINKFLVSPNPFRDQTRIQIDLKETTFATIVIINFDGKVLKTIFDGRLNGQQIINWDGTNEQKQYVPSGIYYCVIQTRDGFVTRKVLYVR